MQTAHTCAALPRVAYSKEAMKLPTISDDEAIAIFDDAMAAHPEFPYMDNSGRPKKVMVTAANMIRQRLQEKLDEALQEG